MFQQIADYREICRRSSLNPDNPNLGLLVVAAAIDRVAKSIDELEIRVVTKKPVGL